MQTGYYSATGGMVTQMTRLDTHSNNLANLNTNAYKRDDVVVGDFLRLYQEKRDELPLRNHTKEAAQFLNRSMARVPHIVESYTDRSIGGFKQTGNDLDFALQREDLYFAVLTPGGVRYTRDGAFNLDQDGNVVTKEGFPVLPREYFEDGQSLITLSDEEPFSVDRDGNFYTNDQPTGNFAIFQFDDVRYLKKEGGSLYNAQNEDQRALVDGTRAVAQGFIEKSNINAVTEMVGLIETNRLVDMYQKVMQTHMNDLNADAVNKLATLRV